MPISLSNPRVALGLAACVACPADAEPRNPRVTAGAGYIADGWYAATGGADRGFAYLDHLQLSLEVAPPEERNGPAFLVSGIYNNGHGLSDGLVGDLQVVSNIEAGPSAARLYEAWAETPLGARASLRVGLYDLNSEFDVLESSLLFLHSAHGIGTDIGQTGLNGPSIFPATSLGARFAWTGEEHWGLRAVVLDAVPGDPDHPGRTRVELGDGEGALVVAEVERATAGGRLLLGGWTYTADFETWDAGGTSGGNRGWYVRGEVPLGDDGPVVFGRYGHAAERFNVFSDFVSTGVQWTWATGQREQALGIAMAWGEASPAFRRRERSAGSATESREVALELTYRIELGHGWSLQPDVQYIVNPGLEPSLEDALALGLRLEWWMP